MLEIDQLPLYELQTMYYLFWKEKEAEKAMTEEERAGAALGKIVEDNI